MKYCYYLFQWLSEFWKLQHVYNGLDDVVWFVSLACTSWRCYCLTTALNMTQRCGLSQIKVTMLVVVILELWFFLELSLAQCVDVKSVDLSTNVRPSVHIGTVSGDVCESGWLLSMSCTSFSAFEMNNVSLWEDGNRDAICLNRKNSLSRKYSSVEQKDYSWDLLQSHKWNKNS